MNAVISNFACYLCSLWLKAYNQLPLHQIVMSYRQTITFITEDVTSSTTAIPTQASDFFRNTNILQMKSFRQTKTTSPVLHPSEFSFWDWILLYFRSLPSYYFPPCVVDRTMSDEYPLSFRIISCAPFLIQDRYFLCGTTRFLHNLTFPVNASGHQFV